MGTARVRRAMTSARGPNISATPSLRTRILSTTTMVLGRWEMITTVVPRFSELHDAVGQGRLTVGIEVRTWLVEDNQAGVL